MLGLKLTHVNERDPDCSGTQQKSSKSLLGLCVHGFLARDSITGMVIKLVKNKCIFMELCVSISFLVLWYLHQSYQVRADILHVMLIVSCSSCAVCMAKINSKSNPSHECQCNVLNHCGSTICSTACSLLTQANQKEKKSKVCSSWLAWEESTIVVGSPHKWPVIQKVFPYQDVIVYPDNQVHEANMGPTWVLSAPDGPHVGLMNLAIRVSTFWTKQGINPNDSVNQNTSKSINRCYSILKLSKSLPTN